MKSICIYCGSSVGRRETYANAARELARTLLERRIRVIYGGSSYGIMGVIAETVLAGDGEIVGVIPEPLRVRELAHPGLTELHVTRSMHERKTKMAELADAFVALPGGIGTLEEIFEIWTWAQLGAHAKPCGMLNVEGYFDPLVAFLDHAVDQSFLAPSHRSMLIVESDPNALLERFAAYRPPAVDAWVATDET